MYFDWGTEIQGLPACRSSPACLQNWAGEEAEAQQPVRRAPAVGRSARWDGPAQAAGRLRAAQDKPLPSRLLGIFLLPATLSAAPRLGKWASLDHISSLLSLNAHLLSVWSAPLHV